VGDTFGGESDIDAESAAHIRRLGLYLHVDAAWAGALSVLPRFRPLVLALSQADSVTIDMHKWPGLPLGTSAFLRRDRLALQRACAVESDYGGSAEDLADCGIEWSRRSRALNVWWRLFLCQDDFARLVTTHFELADQLRRALPPRGWKICNDTLLPVICFSRAGMTAGEAESMVGHLLALGISITSCAWRGDNCLRVAMINANTEIATLEALLAGLDSFG
jgi:glutamate/tyrosine decarboxylase-like PLP-dependent enzyme